MTVLEERSPRKLNMGGARVDIITFGGVLDTVRTQLRGPDVLPLCLASANLDHLGHFGIGGRLRTSLQDDEHGRWLVLLDGKPLQWMANRLTGEPCDLLAGSDLLPHLLELAEREGARVGILGGTSETHRALQAVVTVRYPRLVLAGLWAPTREEFDFDSGEIAALVKAARVDILVVALGKPRQEIWLRDNSVAAGIRVGVAFGAAADFLAGTAKRAPSWWREHGLEWAYRLLHEPRRLAHRYLVRGPVDAYRLLTASSVSSEFGTLSIVAPEPRAAEPVPAPAIPIQRRPEQVGRMDGDRADDKWSDEEASA